MRNFKKILAAVLSAAMVVTLAPAGVATNVQAAAKATKGTSTLKVSATKATIKVGKTKTIKVTVNKKQTAALKVTLKSSKASVAKVASKATIKKGAKTTSFKITAKKAGTANITVSYKTSANKTVKKTIKVTVKNSETNEDNVEVTDGKITIRDISGLQSDGTARLGDTLSVDIPGTLGTIADIIWYCDKLSLVTTTTNQTKTTWTTNRVGTYYAEAITTKGTTYRSDEIKVVSAEAKAKLDGFTITNALDAEDNGEDSRISYSPTDKWAVVTVTMNKSYDGTLAIFKENDPKCLSKVDDVVTKGNYNSTTGAYVSGMFSTDYQWSDTQIIKDTAERTKAKSTVPTGYSYQDQATGATTYKFITTLTRGEKYVIAFDQANITEDSFGKGQENKVESAVTAPYLPAIKKIALTTVNTGANPVLSLYGDEDASLGWIASANDKDTAAANFGIDTVKFFKNSVATVDTADGKMASSGGTVKNGQITATKAATSEAFWYATLKTKKGIYGEKAEEIKSEIKDVAQATATSMKLSQNKDKASSIDVSFANLRADGTVYIVANKTNAYVATAETAKVASGVAAGKDDLSLTTGNVWQTYYRTKFDPSDATSYIKSASVTKGATTVTIEDVILSPTYKGGTPAGYDGAGNPIAGADDTSWSHGYDFYQAIFVPSDSTNYGEVRTANDEPYNTPAAAATTGNYNGLNVTRHAKKIALKSAVKSTVVSASNIDSASDMNTVLEAVDVFGEVFGGDASVFTGDYTLNRSSGKDNTGVKLHLAGDASGNIALNWTGEYTDLVPGETITAKVGDNTLKFTVSVLTKDTTPVAATEIALDQLNDNGGAGIDAGAIVLTLAVE